MVRWILIVLLVGHAALFAGERNPLHNTFYLEGERISYVIVMRADKTFDFYNPAKETVSGIFRTSEDYISFTGDGIRRAFRLELKRNGDMELKRRDDDVTTRNHILGQMPP